VVEPVIVTLYCPALAAVHESIVVKLGGRVALPLMGLHVSPESGLARRDMVPMKLFCPVIVIVEFANLPTITVEGVVSEMVKSVIANLAIAV
jgi:hypothetical protein